MIDHAVIAQRLTADRLRSYLAATDGELDRAVGLYDWNAAGHGVGDVLGECSQRLVACPDPRDGGVDPFPAHAFTLPHGHRSGGCRQDATVRGP